MTFITLCGFLNSLSDGLVDEDNIRIWVTFDNEEVGSESFAGAQGTLLTDFFARFFDSKDIPVVKQKSLCISAVNTLLT